jgi:hypothetical protein
MQEYCQKTYSSLLCQSVDGKGKSSWHIFYLDDGDDSVDDVKFVRKVDQRTKLLNFFLRH